MGDGALETGGDPFVRIIRRLSPCGAVFRSSRPFHGCVGRTIEERNSRIFIRQKQKLPRRVPGDLQTYPRVVRVVVGDRSNDDSIDVKNRCQPNGIMRSGQRDAVLNHRPLGHTDRQHFEAGHLLQLGVIIESKLTSVDR